MSQYSHLHINIYDIYVYAHIFIYTCIDKNLWAAEPAIWTAAIKQIFISADTTAF